MTGSITQLLHLLCLGVEHFYVVDECLMGLQSRNSADNDDLCFTNRGDDAAVREIGLLGELNFVPKDLFVEKGVDWDFFDQVEVNDFL